MKAPLRLVLTAQVIPEEPLARFCMAAIQELRPVTPYGNIKFINATAIAFGAFQFQTNPSLTTAATAQTWATDFAGALDEFRIYDRALTAQEVSALVTLERQGR